LREEFVVQEAACTVKLSVAFSGVVPLGIAFGQVLIVIIQ
jgi:hypothetical protein